MRMKKTLLPAIAAVSLSLGLSMGTHAAGKVKSSDKMSDLEKQSYAAGFAQGGQLRKMDSELSVKFNMQYFQKGFDDAYKDSKPALDETQMDQALNDLQKSIMEKQRTYMESKFTENKKKSDEFLVKTAGESGVKKLQDGILYKVVNSGNGKKNPKATDTVKVTYVGTTIDGREFDSNENVELSLANLIKGWQTALQKMSPGDKWKIYVPADQAYGERGAPGIMPNSALVFDIELKDIVDAKNTKKKSNNS